jgi:hypothetical protein
VFARVHKLRTLGALDAGNPSPADQWMVGILEFSTAVGDGEQRATERLVLRHAQANPQLGALFELYRPELIDATPRHLPLRGIEPIPLGNGQICAVAQEWLVEVSKR